MLGQWGPASRPHVAASCQLHKRECWKRAHLRTAGGSQGAVLGGRRHGEGCVARWSVPPSPATHAILTALKAGEIVFHKLLLTKTVVHALCHIEELNHCFMHYFGVKTLSETLFSPPLMKPGYGTRFLSVSAGGEHSCGVTNESAIECWGGLDAVNGTFQSVSCGTRFACGLRTNGTVTCWGSVAHTGVIPPGEAFLAVSAGHEHSCGIRASDAELTCWGLARRRYRGPDAPDERAALRDYPVYRRPHVDGAPMAFPRPKGAGEWW